ncbi:MAG TPA: OB-fold domain-containing protein [Bryobacteraceae bacterium]|jgi:uncharacterized OB-fold protein|nr:OB-fold domain-containing protein [Bryobacteraceae bacterium]HVW09505.1 OB-fold domain-containing protein [Bryobacteraceae bacterium]
MKAIVYTETVVWSPPEQYAGDAPYQLAIVDPDRGKRRTVRISGERVSIGDSVEFAEERAGVEYYRKA